MCRSGALFGRAMPRQGVITPQDRSRCDCPNGHRGTRRHLEGRLRAGPALPGRRRAGLGEDHAGHAVPHRGRQARRAGPLRHAVGNMPRNCIRSPSRTAGTSPASRFASCCRHDGALESDEQYTMYHPSEVELAVDHQADPRRCAAAEADAGGVRLAVGTAAGRRQPAALSTADSRAQAVLLGPAVHGDPARRHDGGRSRPARPEHRARRDPPAAPQPRVRRRAPAPARDQVSRQGISRRLSRLPDQARAAWRCSRG